MHASSSTIKRESMKKNMSCAKCKRNLEVRKISINNKYWTRKEMPNDTPFFAHGYVRGDGDEVISGPVYYTLPGCVTRNEAKALVEDLMFEVIEDLAFCGGRLEYLELKKNSKFKAKK